MREALHLLVLWSFAVAQPLFGLLTGGSEFFAIRGSGTTELLLFVLVLVFVAPLPLLALQALAGLVGPRLRGGVHLVLVALLLAATLVPLLKRLDVLTGVLGLAVALTLGSLGAFVYARIKLVREYATILTPVLLIFPAFFLLSPSIRGILSPPRPAVTAGADSGPGGSVILVVFDELPIVSLLNEERRIDEQRFPNFADLAGDAIWYRSATSIADLTVDGVPSILTGRYPDASQLPFVQDHPENLFTLLAGSYRMHVSESSTKLCPESICEESRRGFWDRARSLASDVGIIYLHVVLPRQLSDRLPPITQNFKDFGKQARPGDDWQEALREKFAERDARSVQFNRFVDEIEPSDRPTLHFIHVGLPHLPLFFLPSGKAYQTVDQGLPARSRRRDKRWWRDDESAVIGAYQRHLLQLGFTDRLLGKLLSRLRSVGLYDPSLIVVTADHGIHFRPGAMRRRLTADNFFDVLPVPVLVKQPYQSEGVVDDRVFETVDIVPTIAAALGIELPWPVDGHVALGSDPPSGRRIVGYSSKGDRRPGGGQRRDLERLTFELGEFDRRFETLERQLVLFGSGDWSAVYGLGPHDDLVGREVASVGIGTASGAALRSDLPALEFELEPDADLLPALLRGTVSGAAGESPLHLAAAVNGRISGVVPIMAGDSTAASASWSLMVDEESFRAGSNRIDFYLVEGRGDLARLRPVSVTEPNGSGGGRSSGAAARAGS